MLYEVITDLEFCFVRLDVFDDAGEVQERTVDDPDRFADLEFNLGFRPLDPFFHPGRDFGDLFVGDGRRRSPAADKPCLRLCFAAVYSF